MQQIEQVLLRFELVHHIRLETIFLLRVSQVELLLMLALSFQERQYIERIYEYQSILEQIPHEMKLNLLKRMFKEHILLFFEKVYLQEMLSLQKLHIVLSLVIHNSILVMLQQHSFKHSNLLPMVMSRLRYMQDLKKCEHLLTILWLKFKQIQVVLQVEQHLIHEQHQEQVSRQPLQMSSRQ